MNTQKINWDLSTLSHSEDGECTWTHSTDGANFTVCSPTLILFWLSKIPESVIVSIFHVLFYMSFSSGALHFFSMSYPVLFLFLCYLYFSTFVFHVISFARVHVSSIIIPSSDTSVNVNKMFQHIIGWELTVEIYNVIFSL